MNGNISVPCDFRHAGIDFFGMGQVSGQSEGNGLQDGSDLCNGNRRKVKALLGARPMDKRHNGTA